MLVRTEAGGSTVAPLETIIADVEKKLVSLKDSWAERLNQDPSSFAKVEVEVHHTMQQAADQLVAGLLGCVGEQPGLKDASKKSR